MIAYPTEVQNRVAEEVEALPRGTALETMLADYHVMRRQAAACQAPQSTH